jgi:hypothetical protein
MLRAAGDKWERHAHRADWVRGFPGSPGNRPPQSGGTFQFSLRNVGDVRGATPACRNCERRNYTGEIAGFLDEFSAATRPQQSGMK